MRKNPYLRNVLLAAVVAGAMLVLMLIRTFQPGAVLPELDIPNMLGLVSVVLVLNYYLGKNENYCWICSGLMAAVTFGLLPWVAGVVSISSIWKVAVVGGVVYIITNWLFDSIAERLRSGPAGKFGAVMTGLVLFLAGQCFANIIL